MIEIQLVAAIRDALRAAELPEPPGGITVTRTDRIEHGEWTTNVALQLQKATGRAPRDLAARIAEQLEVAPPPHCESVEVAGPGFLNFHLAPGWLHDALRAVVALGERYGHGDALAGQRINLEFVSANPTGPLHAGGARWVAVGDALANLLAAHGAVVHREYYLNDAGNQLDTFGASLDARYRGNEPPDDGYHGDYLVEMADRLRVEHGPDLTREQVQEWGYNEIVRQLRDDLSRIGVEFDTWFSERTLHERGEVADVVEELRARGHVYEADGAVWLASEALGDQRDRVLLKSSGETTYLCTDLAYHRDKFRRGWNHLIDIWGADHHGQVRSLQVGLVALGFPPGEPEIILGQMVKLQRGGQLVRLSKRTGDVVTLADILDEVDPDVCRLTFLLQGIDTTQTFDLDVVTAQSMENPVFYVQYAHARIASIERHAAARHVQRPPLLETDLAPLTHPRELDVLRALVDYPRVLREAAELRAPYKVANWARDLAGRFHGFYTDCRVVSDDTATTVARLWLVEAARIGLASALTILGVGVPEEMARLDARATPATSGR